VLWLGSSATYSADGGSLESALLECWSSREHRRRPRASRPGDRAASEKQLTEVLRALGREHQLRSGEGYAAELAAAQFRLPVSCLQAPRNEYARGMSRQKTLVLVAVMAFTLVGSAAGSASASERSGSLTVTLSGLPSGQRPMAVLRGPRGLHRTVPARGLTIAKARPGLYRLTLGPVKIARANGPIRRGAVATALNKNVSVHVTAGRHSLLQGGYTSIINPGLKALAGGEVSIAGPSEDPSSIVLKGHVALARGNVLSLPPSPMLPRGVLSNVTFVSYGPDTTSASLTAASIYEVAPNFQFDVPLEAKEATTARAASLSASCDPASGLSPYRRIKSVSFSGGWSTADVFGVHITDGVRASVHFTAEAGLDVTAGVGLSCSISLSFYADGMAGPIPVTAGIEGDLSGSAGAGGVLQSGGSIEVKAGGHTIGFPPAMLLIPDVSFANPHFTMNTKQFAQATAGIGLTVKAGVGAGGVASLTLNVGAGLNFSAQPGTCLWNAKFGQFSAEGELLDWHLSTPQTPALFTEQLGGNFCASSGSGGGGGGGSTSSPPTNTSPPTITDAQGNSPPKVGDTLHASTGSWTGSPTEYTYEWEDCKPIGTCTSNFLASRTSTYTVTENDLGDTLRVLVTALNGGGASKPTPSRETGVVGDSVSGGGLGLTARNVAGVWGSSCAVLTGGKVACWGENSHGQLGDGTTTGPQTCYEAAFSCSTIPVLVNGITNAVQVATNSDLENAAESACALLVTGGIDCWGYGGLGTGTEFSSDVPVPVSGISNATQVSVSATPCAVLETGHVDCWGIGGFGELGNGTESSSPTPVTVSGITNATEVATGRSFACALLASGHVECWGYAAFGTLGDGTDTGPGCASSDGGGCSTTPVPVSGITDATQISAGGLNACAVLKDGTVDCWGENSYGSLGDATETGPETCYDSVPCSNVPVAVRGVTNATQVGTGEAHACALLAGGTADCWGEDAFGELGDGTTARSDVPVNVRDIGNAIEISSGNLGSCVVLTTGKVDCWGNNGSGGLGDGTNTGPELCLHAAVPCSAIPVQVSEQE